MCFSSSICCGSGALRDILVVTWAEARMGNEAPPLQRRGACQAKKQAYARYSYGFLHVCVVY